MPDTVTARDANHHFARILNEVKAGKEFVVTRNGVPVAVSCRNACRMGTGA